MLLVLRDRLEKLNIDNLGGRCHE